MSQISHSPEVCHHKKNNIMSARGSLLLLQHVDLIAGPQTCHVGSAEMFFLPGMLSLKISKWLALWIPPRAPVSAPQGGSCLPISVSRIPPKLSRLCSQLTHFSLRASSYCYLPSLLETKSTKERDVLLDPGPRTVLGI